MLSDKRMICNYGCGQEGIHYFKTVSKWCCSESHNSCPTRKEFMSRSRKGENHPLYGKVGFWKNKKRPIHSKEMKGKNHPFYGKRHSELTKKRIGISNKYTISKIKNKYKIFSIEEEMRYNPAILKEKEIQVHCKNHNCENSKENGGWFTPTRGQLYKRIESIENPIGFGETNFYCSDGCKNKCPLYRTRGKTSLKTKEMFYVTVEYTQFREFVLKRDNHKCQYCEEKANHVHHERPQKLEPFFSLDPDLAWSVCEKCHYKKAHQEECSTGQLAKKVC